MSNVAINTNAAQTPTATSFDASQDLLIAQKITEVSQPASLSMKFARMVAIGKMTVKNLGSSDDITKITFSAKVGVEDVVLAGRTAFNLETGLPTSEYGSNTADHSIILNYEGKGIKANTAEGMTAYFTCYPFALNATTPGSFKVIVETATKSFTKEVSVSSAKGLVFRTGQASVFSVDMDGIAGTDKAVDLCYACLVPTDVTLGNSYGNATVTKTHGDKWSMYACDASGSIGVRNNDKDNDSYIKLPDFVDDIKTVVVTLNSPVLEKTITLEDSATGKAGSIASLSTTAATVYTFNLGESSGIKTAYFRSNGAQAKVEKIEVYAGTDDRSKLTTPASVTAVRNTEDDDITNKIDVSWASVSGAIGYEVTLTPTAGDAVVRTTASTSCSIGDLEYSTSYTPSVVAIADPYLNLNSLAGTGSAAATAAAPTILFLNSSALSSLAANSYGTVQSFVVGGYTWRHTGNRAASSGYIQLREPATRYIEIPIVPGTIRKVVFSVTNASASSEGDTGNKCKNNLTFSCLDYSVSSDIDTENGVNEITLTPAAATYRNGFITASGPIRIWNIKVYYSADDATLSSITITTAATKTTYSKDEEIVFDGKVRGNYSNSSIADVTSLVTVTGDTSSAGSKDVTVSYGGQSTTYAITVSAGSGVSGLSASWTMTAGSTTSLASATGNKSATLTTTNNDSNTIRGFSAGIASQKMTSGNYWLFTIPSVANVLSTTEVTINFSGVKVNNNSYRQTYQLEYSWDGTNWTSVGSTYQETTSSASKEYTFTPGEKVAGTLYIRYRSITGGGTGGGSHYLGAVTLSYE